MSDVKITTWSVEPSPVVIEYSMVVIEEIRQVVAEGFQRLSRGGIEVGGVLYGTRDGHTIRILAIRQIACEHARGPSFVLSEKDRAALGEQLALAQSDPKLQEMAPLGWFVSHTRSEIALSETDLTLYSTFFPSPWQVTLVVRPGRAGAMRAGFFFREADGKIQYDRSYLDFNFPDRLSAVLDRPPRERGTPDRPTPDRSPMAERAPMGAMRPAQLQFGGERLGTLDAPPPREFPGFSGFGAAEAIASDENPSKRKWTWLIVWAAVVLIAAVVGLRYFSARTPVEPVALSVLEREGQLQIGWNNASKTVTSASRGSLEIVDGKNPLTVVLSPQDLAQGKFTYVRKTGEISVRLTVENASGEKTQEASRFLGPPPGAVASTDETSGLKQRNDELEAKIRGLEQQNEQQAGRIQQLERTLLILRTRIGGDGGR